MENINYYWKLDFPILFILCCWKNTSPHNKLNYWPEQGKNYRSIVFNRKSIHPNTASSLIQQWLFPSLFCEQHESFVPGDNLYPHWDSMFSVSAGFFPCYICIFHRTKNMATLCMLPWDCFQSGSTRCVLISTEHLTKVKLLWAINQFAY